MPINEIDYMIFSQLVYNNFDGIAVTSEHISLSSAAEEFFTNYSDADVDALIDVAQRAGHMLKACKDTERFGSAVINNYINNVDGSLDKQISAMSFLLDDGSILVSFRGTDASVAGFKESAMLTYMFPIPAQIEALHYFQETAMLHDGAVRLCGHSKGGNLAVFAAVNCSNSLQKKIDGIYSFDAPGFPEWFFERHDYQQIENKLNIYNPHNSLVGRALCMKKEPNIVISTAKHGRQHNVATWIIDDAAFRRADAYTADSDKLSGYFNNLISEISDKEFEVFYDALEQTANQMGVSDFYDLKEVDTNMLSIIVDSIQTLNPEQKKRFNSIARNLLAFVAKEYVSGAVTKTKKAVKTISGKIPFVGKNKDSAEQKEPEA